MKLNKRKIFHVLGLVVWSMIGMGLIFLLVSAIKKEDAAVCKEVKVKFNDEQNYRMLNESEILSSLWPGVKNDFPFGNKPASFDLFRLEKQLEKNPWVLSADLYFDQQHTLNIHVKQRVPVARVFTPAGSSFYMDASYAILPVKSSDIISLPVFTNFYVNPAIANATDSSVLKRISSLSTFILSDSLWMAQIEEIYINPDGGFELTTQMGDQVVLLGDRDDWAHMFMKLKRMYTHFTEADSWSKYSKVDVQYKDQVVCVKQGGLMQLIDSTKALDSIIVNKH
jgi:cell division protein FtsQ